MNMSSNFSESLTKEAIEEILKLQKDTNEKVIQIMMNNHGNIPFLFTNMLNPMRFEVPKEDQR